MSRRNCVTLKARDLPKDPTWDLFNHPKEFKLALLGHLFIKDTNLSERYEGRSDSQLAVWFCTISKKLFFWEEPHAFGLIKLKAEESTYRQWPIRLYDISPKDIEKFIVYVRIWGTLHFEIDQKDLDELNAEKAKLIGNLQKLM